MKQKKSIGIEVPAPKKECNDKNCPFHGTIGLRGRSFIGEVLSAKAQKSAVVGWDRWCFLPKYERYERRKSRISVHNPECINAKQGDRVKVVETKPLSKTKNFIIVQVIEEEK